MRQTAGATNPSDPEKATPGSIRADYGLDMGRNLIHASDGVESATREIALYFRPEELLDWTRDTDRWIFEWTFGTQCQPSHQQPARQRETSLRLSLGPSIAQSRVNWRYEDRHSRHR